ncbi:unnamed protein product [Chrysodeixis includens]|uniref:Kinetochore protein SPC25 n=1 Tax=Chrysodeixis includens TaxID=689277 RepID=A0A9N8L3J5_CHRIL|nr:unnamed protein product [Chrysodeixis includens]
MSIIEKHWDIQFNLDVIEENSYREFEDKMKSLHEQIISHIENGFRVQKGIYNGNIAQNHDDELKNLIEQNKQLRYNIDTKVEELSKQKIQYENYKKDQKLLSQEIKETHEAFLMAKKYYKKFLKMYYTIESKSSESHTIFVQFFTESKKESENYSVRLSRDAKTGSYKLLSVTPKLPEFKEFQQTLQETNDVPGALCSIREAFLTIKTNKK